MTSAGGSNCLVPIDGSNESDVFIAEESYYSVNRIMNYLASHRTTEHIPIIFILDCCRSEIAMENHDRVNLSNFQGDTTNAFIMYATSSNKTASDGKGANGMFTELLLKYMDMDDEIASIARAIRTDLRDKSKGKQVCALITE